MLFRSQSLITASVGVGCVLFPYSVIEANAVIRDCCILASSVVINHGAQIDECVLVNTGTVIRPNTRNNKYASIGRRYLITMNKEIEMKRSIEDAYLDTTLEGCFNIGNK